VTKRNWSDYR